MAMFQILKWYLRIKFSPNRNAVSYKYADTARPSIDVHASDMKCHILKCKIFKHIFSLTKKLFNGWDSSSCFQRSQQMITFPASPIFHFGIHFLFKHFVVTISFGPYELLICVHKLLPIRAKSYNSITQCCPQIICSCSSNKMIASITDLSSGSLWQHCSAVISSSFNFIQFWLSTLVVFRTLEMRFNAK